MPKRADDDIKWLIVYVMLSRVRSLSRLRSIGLAPKIRKIIEGGPPNMLAENFEILDSRLFVNEVALTAHFKRVSAVSPPMAFTTYWCFRSSL